ncbi:MAG: penicillin-binding transpeptidase domain-containing protein [Eubacteriales bacterium]|nr:penicillin-binding transpeptidase domain-containing protein [Eubacteriales bacterium]
MKYPGEKKVFLTMRKRLLFVFALLLAMIIGLLLRLTWLQIVNGPELQRLASIQQSKGKETYPRRGSILDRNGNELAVSAAVYTISINARDMNNKYDAAFIKNLADKMCDLLDIEGEEAEAVILKFSSTNGYELIKAKTDIEIGNKVKEWVTEAGISDVNIDIDSKRYYPYGSLASHVIGFTRTDNVGNDGIEAIMEEYLRGVPGKMLREVDAQGFVLPFFGDEYYIKPQDGLNVVLTIDETIQHLASEALDKAIEDFKVLNGAAAIVMDPNTGEILAMVSKPDYDLNHPWAAPPGIENEGWTGSSSDDVKILQSSVWRNKAISDLYEPGSVFKSITAAAALEEAAVTPETRVDDYPVELSGYLLECWSRPNLHGEESFREAMYNSCNPVFVKVARQIGIAAFYKYVKAFGFYDRTGISLYGESSGYFHEIPTELDMAVASFGQRFQVTPIEVICAYAAIANGGKLIRPMLVKELRDSSGSLVRSYKPEVVRSVISRTTSDTLRDILQGVVTYGTGHNAYVPGYRVAGKTGTSETTYDEDRYIASFSAFAPADNPAVCVLVILDNPSGEQYMGGVTAASVAGRLVRNILDHLGVEKIYTEEEAANIDIPVTVPALTGMGTAEALTLLDKLGLGYKIADTLTDAYGNRSAVNMEDKIFEQAPKAGTTVVEGSLVFLYTYEPDEELLVTVPDIQGLGISEAAAILNDSGLNLRSEGSGTAVRQSIPAGSSVKAGQVIEADFLVLGIDVE